MERCNLDEVRSRIALAEQQIAELERQQRALPAEIDKLDREILRLDREIAQIDGSFAQLEQQMSATNMAVNRASELVRETTWFDLQLKDRVGIAQRLALIDKRLEGARQKTALERERAAAAIGDLAGLFGQLVATLMPKGCFGKMKLDGNGLHPEISLERGAGLSTAAVESFKIVAFDLAAMILSVNGKADMPAFLIHDSPREADLDSGIYANLFDFVLSLEKKGGPPPFQYIVTTTTAPSKITLDHPALRLQLSSTPPEARLFAMDF